MARALGYNCKLYLDGFDRSADTTAFTGGVSADTVDVTSWGSNGWKQFLATLTGGEISFDMMWDPTAVTGVGPQMVAELGAATVPTITINEAGAVGDSAIVMPSCILEKLSIPIKPADIMRMTVGFKVSGSMGLGGLVLQPAVQKTTTGNATSIDNTAASAAGGRANFNFTEITGGAARFLVEDSADNSSFATIADSGSQASITGVSVAVSGAVRRYVRARWSTIATSATCIVSFVRF